MNDVYGEVPDWRRLVPRERHVVTGRLSGRRDDKQRDDQQPDADSNALSHQGARPSGRSPARLSSSASLPAVAATVVAVLAVVGVVGLLGARALGGPSREVTAAATGTTGALTPGTSGSSGSSGTTGAAGSPGLSGTAPAGGTPAAGAPAVATAITLEYSGGRLTTDECSDPSGRGACEKYDSTQYDPLTVRCTAAGCTVYFVREGPLAGPLTMSGTTNAAAPGCEETRWTLTLTPVGQAVTEGIRHPARIVGEARLSRPAEQLPTVTCLGAEQAYTYDATPS